MRIRIFKFTELYRIPSNGDFTNYHWLNQNRRISQMKRVDRVVELNKNMQSIHSEIGERAYRELTYVSYVTEQKNRRRNATQAPGVIPSHYDFA